MIFYSTNLVAPNFISKKQKMVQVYFANLNEQIKSADVELPYFCIVTIAIYSNPRSIVKNSFLSSLCVLRASVVY